MAVYRELFFNNILDTLGNAFPILSRLLTEAQWQKLCETFFAEHRCETPYLSHVPGEFVEYVLEHRGRYPRWLPELAQWEWTELELFLAPDADLNTAGGARHLLDGIPLLSLLLRLHAFDYPVHRLGPDNPPGEPGGQPCYLLAWRKRDHTIGFLELNTLSALLVQRLRDNRRYSGHELLCRIADEQHQHAPEVIIEGGTETLYNFYRNGIVTGSEPLPAKETPDEHAA